jgi:hypothetical protein
MALTGSDREERIRLIHIANGYRANAARIEPLNVHGSQGLQLLPLNALGEACVAAPHCEAARSR